MNFARPLLLWMLFASTAQAESAFDSEPWLEDLHQMRDAFAEKYANFEWAVFEREANLSDLFLQTETRLSAATSDAEAHAAFDRFTRTLGVAARIVSPVKLRSERMDFVRGAHWIEHWTSLQNSLLSASRDAPPEDRKKLIAWAKEVERATAEATRVCSSAAFWSGSKPDCDWLGRGFYTSGLLAEADAAALSGKPWGPLVFSPATYEFEESVWRGSLVVLVDGGTGSAAERFAAVLQDNQAALIVGSPTAGAGCGYTNGGTPTVLTHSGATLRLPHSW